MGEILNQRNRPSYVSLLLSMQSAGCLISSPWQASSCNKEFKTRHDFNNIEETEETDYNNEGPKEAQQKFQWNVKKQFLLQKVSIC